MKLKTWEDFERIVELCKKCQKPEGTFKGLFCREHGNAYIELFKELHYPPYKGSGQHSTNDFIHE